MRLGGHGLHSCCHLGNCVFVFISLMSNIQGAGDAKGDMSIVEGTKSFHVLSLGSGEDRAVIIDY